MSLNFGPGKREPTPRLMLMILWVDTRSTYTMSVPSSTAAEHDSLTCATSVSMTGSARFQIGMDER